MLLMQQAINATSTAAARSTGTAASSLTQISTSSDNPDGVESLQDQIKAAIAAALQSLDKTSSADTIMNTIKNAVDQTLRANGIEPPSGPGGPGGPPPSGSAPPPGGSSRTDKSGNDLMSIIDSLLQQNGFDPAAIRSQLQQEMSAAQTTSTGASGSMTLILQLPLTGVDTQA
jgi:hypothetical protein